MPHNPVTILKAAATSGCAAVFFACAVAPTGAWAGELSARGDACANRLEIDARNVPLKDVLDRASKILGMTYKVDDPALVAAPVTAARSGEAQAVLKALLAGRNVVIETQPLARCGGAERVARIWILRPGEDGARTAASTAQVSERSGAPAGRHGRPNRGRVKASEPSHQSKQDESSQETNE